jgi:hypothetical protein
MVRYTVVNGCDNPAHPQKESLMNTATHATELLSAALEKTREATRVINDLIVAHEYQDVAVLVAQAGEALLESAALLMQSKDEAALDALDRADDLLDSVYTIIDGETDE